MAEDTRLASGSRCVIENNLRDKHLVINHELDYLFEEKIMRVCTEIKDKPTEHFDEHVVLCNDLDGLVDKVIRCRNLHKDNTLIRIGIDGGGGFLKYAFRFLILMNLHCRQKPWPKSSRTLG